MSKTKCSNSNLNNKNNLASVFLKQRLAQFDREQKYSIYHIERSKISTNHFLTQIKQCDTFLTTGSLELLGRNKDKKQDEVDSEACVQKPPSGHSKPKSPVKRGTTVTPVMMGAYLTPKLKEKLETLSVVRDEWYKEGLKKRETSFQRGEKFLEKLREKERYIDAMKNSSDDEEDYNPLLRNAKSSITRLPSFRKPSTRPYSSGDRTARSKKSIDRGTIKRHDSVIKRLDSTFENLSIDEEPTSKSEVNVKFPRVTEQCRPSVAWQGNEIEEADDEDEEDDPPDDMMREFLNLKMKVKRKPLHSRIDEFYGKLDDMKKQKEERERSLPYFEKRRKWLMLTRGKADDFDEDY